MSQPTLPTLPTFITPEMVRQAALPMKILAMEKAIADCTDPFLLKPIADYTRAMATAARVVKHEIPQQYEKLKEISHNSELRLGELFNEYSAAGGGYGGRGKISERVKVAKQLGINRCDLSALTRLAAAPEKVKTAFRKSDLTRAAGFIRRDPDKVPTRIAATSGFSIALRSVMEFRGTGIVASLRHLRGVSEADLKNLAAHEKALVSGVLTECEQQIERIRQALDVRP